MSGHADEAKPKAKEPLPEAYEVRSEDFQQTKKQQTRDVTHSPGGSIEDLRVTNKNDRTPRSVRLAHDDRVGSDVDFYVPRLHTHGRRG